MTFIRKIGWAALTALALVGCDDLAAEQAFDKSGGKAAKEEKKDTEPEHDDNDADGSSTTTSTSTTSTTSSTASTSTTGGDADAGSGGEGGSGGATGSGGEDNSGGSGGADEMGGGGSGAGGSGDGGAGGATTTTTSTTTTTGGNDAGDVCDADDVKIALPCNTGKLGICAKGTCSWKWNSPTCVATGKPYAEICDGFDNDCDGDTDEGDVCDGGAGGSGGAATTGSGGEDNSGGSGGADEMGGGGSGAGGSGDGGAGGATTTTTSTTTTTGGDPLDPNDLDGDGYKADAETCEGADKLTKCDCDDNASNVHPGATEDVGGKDLNCDSYIEPNAVICRMFLSQPSISTAKMYIKDPWTIVSWKWDAQLGGYQTDPIDPKKLGQFFSEWTGDKGGYCAGGKCWESGWWADKPGEQAYCHDATVKPANQPASLYCYNVNGGAVITVELKPLANPVNDGCNRFPKQEQIVLN